MKVWHDGHSRFIVETREEESEDYGTLAYGHLVDVKDGVCGSEQLVASIANMMPMSDFQEFTGDAAPVLKLLDESGKRK